MTKITSSATAKSKSALQERLGGSRAWLIWSLAAISFGYAFFQRVAPSVMVSDLMAQFAIGGGMLGILSALYFYPYVLLQVPLGALIDRFGARMLLVTALTLAGIGSLIFGSAHHISIAYFGRVLIGIGSCVGFLASLALASKWFRADQFAMLAGLTMFSGMMSGILGQGPLALFIETFGWRASQWSLGAFALVLAVLVFAIVRNAPPHIAEEGEAENQEKQSWRAVWQGFSGAACNLNVWKVAFVATALSAPMLTIGGLWGTPYVMQAYGLGRAEAAFFVSLLLLGVAFGAPLNGWVSDRLKRRKPMLIAGCAVSVCMMALVVFVPALPLFALVGILIVAGFAGGTISTTFALVRETTKPEITGAAFGIVNGMTVASGAILQPLVGFALDYLWEGQTVDGSPVYQSADFRLAFGLVLAAAVMGLLVSFTLPRSRLNQSICRDR